MRGIAILTAGLAWAVPETWLVIGLVFVVLALALPACRHWLRFSPRASAARNPALKASPAPVVSTDLTGRAGAWRIDGADWLSLEADDQPGRVSAEAP